MKNLLIYTHPQHGFDYEHETLAKIQIDNSLGLGWERKDILLATNFDYEYNGVRSLVVADTNICRFAPTVAKVNVIIELYERGLIGEELFWLHDFDAYQHEVITEEEIGDAEFALTDYGRMARWSTGSIFLRSSAIDIFKWIHTICYAHYTHEERALWALMGNDTRRWPSVDVWIRGYKNTETGIEAERIKKLDITYNFPPQALSKCYETAIKPIKVSHFHLMRKWLDSFISGRNEFNQVLVPERLRTIFRHHGVT